MRPRFSLSVSVVIETLLNASEWCQSSLNSETHITLLPCLFDRPLKLVHFERFVWFSEFFEDEPESFFIKFKVYALVLSNLHFPQFYHFSWHTGHGILVWSHCSLWCKPRLDKLQGATKKTHASKWNVATSLLGKKTLITFLKAF